MVRFGNKNNEQLNPSPFPSPCLGGARGRQGMSLELSEAIRTGMCCEPGRLAVHRRDRNVP